MKKVSLFALVLALVFAAPLLIASQNTKTPRTMPVDGSSGRDAVSPTKIDVPLGRQTVIDSIPAPGSAHMGLAWDGTYLWNVSNASTPIVAYQIDPQTGAVVNTITTGINTYVLGCTYLNGSLWIQEWWSFGYTYEVDPVTGSVLSYFTSPAGVNSRGLTNDGTYLWIMDAPGAVAYQVTTTGSVVRSVSMPFVDWAMDAAWNFQRGTLFLCDDGAANDIKELDVSGSTAVLLDQFAHPGAIYTPEGITYDGQYLWTTAYDAAWIWKIDIGDQAPAFWDFETGLQGWTHTNGVPYPGGWDVEASDEYPAYMVPDPGDSTMWVSSDASGGGISDTALSPVVVPPNNMTWLKYGFVNYDDAGSTYMNELHVGLKYFTGGMWSAQEYAYYPPNVQSGPAWDSVDVSAHATADSVQVYFYYTDLGTWGYIAAFDNVGLYAPPSEDVGVTTILEPVGIHSLNDVVTPQAEVRNFGDTDETFPVIFTMTLNAVLVYADTVDVTLLSGAADTAVFNSYTFTQAGSYDVVSYTELAGDMNPANDSAFAMVSIFEWFHDLEANDAGFVAAPPAGGWEWGAPTSGPGAAHSGTNVWATILAGPYANYANWTLTSQDDYVATQDNPVIAFYSWYDIETYWDGGNVKYSTDGMTWLLLYPAGGYDDVASTANAGIPAESCFTGHPAIWEAEEVIIPVTSGQNFKLRFHFGSDGSVTYPGWYIDDLAGLGCYYVGIEEEPGSGHVAVFGFAPNMSTVHRNHVPIAYSTTAPSHVSLKVYDNMGRLVRTLVDAQQPAGEKSVLWDNKDLNKRAVANGVYFLKLEAEGQTAVRKLILVK